MASIEQLRELAERLQTSWSSLNERDDIARLLWNSIKADVGDELSFSDCQRSVGGSIDATLALSGRVLPLWLFGAEYIMQNDGYADSCIATFTKPIGEYRPGWIKWAKDSSKGLAPNLADAILRAMVAALIAQEEAQ